MDGDPLAGGGAYFSYFVSGCFSMVFFKNASVSEQNKFRGSIEAGASVLVSAGFNSRLDQNLLIGYGIEAKHVGRPIIRSDSKVRSNHVRDDVLATQARKSTD